jgi:hypothetical protein
MDLSLSAEKIQRTISKEESDCILGRRAVLAQLLAAISADGPAAGIQRATFQASDVHGAREEVRDHGTHAQDGHHQGDLLES